ncbi:MAG: hypothetical protein V2J62_01720 [candidate division KSB1 bacterium]|jgi:hypothetical protein|nr:hypothetical protein [candidate division KSB1 bacterium]
MSVLNFIIAIVALIIAVMAYKKAIGGSEKLQEQINSIREKTAGALGKAEERLRPKE